MRAKLSELGTVIMGNTPSKQESKYWASSDIPFIKPDAINQDGIQELQTANEYISEAARSKARIVGKSVVLVTCIGTIGKICLTGKECAFNQQINAIIPNDRVLPEYLAYCLYYNRPKLIELANAPVVPIINKRQFEDFSVNIEENVEQQGSIVTILKKVDRLIHYRQQQLQKLDDLVKARFVELFGDPKINSHNYPLRQFSDYIVFLTSGSRGWAQYCVDNGTEWFITIKNVKDCHILTDNMQSINAPNNVEAKRTRVQEGDLLISITADLGRTGVVTKEIAEHGAYINQHLTCVRLKQDVLNPLYAAYFMESPAGKEQFESKNQSAVKAGLNFNSINSLRLIVPPLDEQNAFVDFIKQTDKSKAVIQRALDEAHLLLDSLMQRYLE